MLRVLEYLKNYKRQKYSRVNNEVVFEGAPPPLGFMRRDEKWSQVRQSLSQAGLARRSKWSSGVHGLGGRRGGRCGVGGGKGGRCSVGVELYVLENILETNFFFSLLRF